MTKPNVFTAVFRDVTTEEAGEIANHPKWSAGSWSHALDDRDAARAALTSSDAQADGGKSEAVAYCRRDTVLSWQGQLMNAAWMFPSPQGLKDPMPLYTTPQAECAPRAQLSDERIHEVIAGIYGACATDQEMRLARAILDAAKEQ